jgi:wyosine [tRNA(Phe)-imidazoG37] synthetase (radical SAM superfamily)
MAIATEYGDSKIQKLIALIERQFPFIRINFYFQIGADKWQISFDADLLEERVPELRALIDKHIGDTEYNLVRMEF